LNQVDQVLTAFEESFRQNYTYVIHTWTFCYSDNSLSSTFDHLNQDDLQFDAVRLGQFFPWTFVADKITTVGRFNKNIVLLKKTELNNSFL
jgi:hypothetical protein